MKSLRKQVGQLLIVGLEAPELAALEKAWLKLLQPGGVILFRRNIETAEQTWKLLAATEAVSPGPIFRCVDLEGGLVDRLRDVIVPMPSLAAVAIAGRLKDFRKHGLLIGKEAQALGFNTVLAPVLDLATPASLPVMSTRVQFADPARIALYGENFLAALQAQNILGCAKHFPGLGHGNLDSHHATPVIDRTFDQLWREDLLPYRKLKSQLPIIMVSHASYPNAGTSQPASISKYWITKVLTKRIGYRGLILSDDLEMGGILNRTAIEEASVQAIAAGTHLLEICKSPDLIVRAYEALLTEAEISPAFRTTVEAAARKVARSKSRLLKPMPSQPPSRQQMARLQKEVHTFRAAFPEPAVQAKPS